MIVAYVLVKANTGDADRVLGQLKAIEGVVDAHVVAGDVDFIVKVEVESPADVKGIAAGQIQDVDGVEGTETYIAMA